MKRRWLPIGLSLLAGAALLAANRTAGIDWLASRLHAQQPAVRPGDTRPPRPGQPQPGDPGSRGLSGRAIGPLNHAYDEITCAAVWMSSSQAKLSRQDSGLLDQSKDLYRKALQAYRTGQYRHAEGLALAAQDAGRGVVHVLQANTSAVEGLPLPPLEAEAGTPPPPRSGREVPPAARDRETAAPRPADRVAPPPPLRDRPVPQGGAQARPPLPDRGDARREDGARGGARVRDAIREVREELQEVAQGSPPAAARPFVDAARRALDEAQKAAGDGHHRRAIHFVMAAEAWSHVPEHLRRAEGGTRGVAPRTPGLREPAPDVRRDSTRPPERRPATPPPAIRDR